MIPATWIEHRRSQDGELLGWIDQVGADFVVIDRLGRPRTEPTDWFTAETFLDQLGIGYLAAEFLLHTEGTPTSVRILEVSSTAVIVTTGLAEVDSADLRRITVPFPVGSQLREA